MEFIPCLMLLLLVIIYSIDGKLISINLTDSLYISNSIVLSCVTCDTELKNHNKDSFAKKCLPRTLPICAANKLVKTTGSAQLSKH